MALLGHKASGPVKLLVELAKVIVWLPDGRSQKVKVVVVTKKTNPIGASGGRISDGSGLVGIFSYLEGFNWRSLSFRPQEKPERKGWVAACVPQTVPVVEVEGRNVHQTSGLHRWSSLRPRETSKGLDGSLC